MQYTKIPGTDMQASRICLGTMTFGSPVAGPDAVRLVRYALEEHGVNFIDTANMYEGYNRYAGSAGGVAEEIVGEAVAHRRGDYILATKVGMKVGEAPEDENTSPEAIRIQLRRSLARMRTDYVDVYYLHRYDPDTEPHAVARAMGEELRAGTIRAWGVSNYTAAQLAALLGLGIGLTPSGDDFLCGMLAGSILAGRQREPFFLALRAEIAAGLSQTNDISAAFLQCALDGQFSEPVLALTKPEPEAARIAESFSKIGHSSGFDTLCGIVFCLRQPAQPLPRETL